MVVQVGKCAALHTTSSSYHVNITVPHSGMFVESGGSPCHTMSEMHEYHFEVKMACSSCSGAVERVLSRLEGVTSYEVSLEKQSVDVKGTVDYDTVLATIKKTGKQVLNGSVTA